MIPNFDDSPSQSTNSTSSNLNSFPSSNSRIWSSSVGINTSTSTTNKHSNHHLAAVTATATTTTDADDSLLDSISIAIRTDASAVDFHNSNITVDEYYHLLNTDNAPSPASSAVAATTTTATATAAPFIPNSSTSWRFDGINANSNVTVNSSLNGNGNGNHNGHSFSDANFVSNFSAAPVPASSFSANANTNSKPMDKRNLFASNLNRDPLSVSNLNSDSSLALPNHNHNHNHKNNRYHAQGQGRGQGYMNMHQPIIHTSHVNATHMNQRSQQQQQQQQQQQRSQLQSNLNPRAPPNTGQSQYHPEDLSATMQGMHMDTARTDTNSNVNVNVNPASTGIYPNQIQHGHGSAAGYSMMDPLENILGPFPCVRLRNLPYDATLEDVLLFFHGLMMLDINILPPPVFHGQHHQVQSCEAFVLFANPADFQMAFQRHRQQMRHGTFVDVFQGKRHDYYAAVSSQFMHFQQVHRRGEESHTGRSVSPYASSNIPTQSLRGSANAGASMNVNAQHLQHMSMHQTQPGPAPLPGTRPRSSRSDSRGKAAGRGSGRGGGIQVGEHTGYLRMRGLPFSTTKNDIFEFFEGYEPIEESICLTYRSDGRATGEGYVGFASIEGAERAMDLHKKSLGSRYIELFISNKEEHGRAKTREPKPESPTPPDQPDAETRPGKEL